MPFEVKVIAGPRDASETDQTSRSENAVAEEIREFYEHAAEMGGKVVGSHELTVETTLTREGPSRSGGRPAEAGQVGKSVLFLVAEVRDPEEEPIQPPSA